MADPMTPRLPGQPPPLPPLPLRPLTAADQLAANQLAANAGAAPFDPRMAEPFPPADDRAPDTLRLGSPAPRATILPPPPDPLTESTGQLLRQELALVREVLREALPTQPALPALPPVPSTEPALLAAFAGPGSLRTRSRAAVAVLTAGKYGGVVLLGGIALRALAKVWPASGHTIEAILEALGL